MEPNKKRPFSRKTFPLVFVGISGLIITTIVFFTFRGKELQEVKSNFYFTANNLTSEIKDVLENDIDTLRLIEALFQGSEFVTRGEFEKFVQPVLERHPHILVFGWLPLIRPEECSAFNQKLNQEGFLAKGPNGAKSQACKNGENRRGCFPIYYLEGPAKRQLEIGFNIAASEKIYKALEDSAQSRTLGAVEIGWPINGKSSQRAYMVFLPIFGKNFLFENNLERNRHSLGGFIFGLFPVSDILQKIQAEHALSGIKVEVSEPFSNPSNELSVGRENKKGEILQDLKTFNIGNRELVIRTQANPGYVSQRLSWRPAVSFAAGIFMVGLLLLYLEYTFRRTAQIELLAERLSGEVAERQRVAEARERLVAELEAKNAELERFTYTVSHDLKSPLITIRGFSGLLVQDAHKGDVERIQADVNQINSATDKMQRLLDELLDLSRIGRLVNPSREIPLNDLIQETLDILIGRISEAGVEISVPAELPVVYGDRPRLLEVFQNLIENAIKFMGNQPNPRIEIFAEPWDEQVACFVRDNGIGIPKDYQTKVFGLFERLDQTTEGTGIGLALVKRIVEFHGGRIWVESDGEGRGATFVLTLPVKQEGKSDE